MYIAKQNNNKQTTETKKKQWNFRGFNFMGNKVCDGQHTIIIIDTQHTHTYV